MIGTHLVFLPVRKYRAGAGPSLEDQRGVMGADTLFGALCWSCALLHGSDALVELLSRFERGDPPFLVSSAFPARMSGGNLTVLIPVPKVPGVRRRLQKVAERQRDEKVTPKTVERIELGTAKAVEMLLAGEHGGLKIFSGYAGVFLAQEGEQLPEIRTVKSRRASLDRTTMGSAVFRFSATELGDGCGLAFWVRFLDDWEPFEGCVRLMSELGIGGETSVGLGLSEGEPKVFWNSPPMKERGRSFFVTLSPYVPTRDEIALIVKGRDAARYSLQERTAMYAGLGRVRYHVIGEGSVLPYPTDRRAIGRMLRLPNGIYRYGYAFLVGLDARDVTG